MRKEYEPHLFQFVNTYCGSKPVYYKRELKSRQKEILEFADSYKGQFYREYFIGALRSIIGKQKVNNWPLIYSWFKDIARRGGTGMGGFERELHYQLFQLFDITRGFYSYRDRVLECTCCGRFWLVKRKRKRGGQIIRIPLRQRCASCRGKIK